MAGFMLAIATRSPWSSRMRALKSRPSLKIGEYEVRISALAISSQTLTSWSCSSLRTSGSGMEHQAAAGVDLGVPARRDDGGGVDLLDHGRPGDALPYGEHGALVDRRVEPLLEADRAHGVRLAGRAGRRRRVGRH